MDVELCLKEMGRRIMERRKGMGLTQEALAEKSDLTTQFVSYAESGKRGMRSDEDGRGIGRQHRLPSYR